MASGPRPLRPASACLTAPGGLSKQRPAPRMPAETRRADRGQCDQEAPQEDAQAQAAEASQAATPQEVGRVGPARAFEVPQAAQPARAYTGRGEASAAPHPVPEPTLVAVARLSHRFERAPPRGRHRAAASPRSTRGAAMRMSGDERESRAPRTEKVRARTAFLRCSIAFAGRRADIAADGEHHWTVSSTDGFVAKLPRQSQLRRSSL